MSHATPATLLCDFYKISHREQYPAGTTKIYSTWTARASRLEGVNHVVAFGFQAFIKEYLIDYFNTHFFSRPKAEVVAEYVRVIKYTLGIENPDAQHIAALHDVGYLPIEIRAVKEGTRVPIRVPMLTIENTQPEFFWLTNYLETLMSCSMWMASTSATLAFEYRQILERYAKLTDGDTSIVPFQAHDFSMRGMGSLESSKVSGAGHLLSFTGTDAIPSIIFMEEFYGANIEKELVGTSIPATEHSVMCAHGQDELSAYRHILNNVYPTGFVSVVSDTWDLWKVLTGVLPALKKDIMKRDGKLVIRPDSGDPVKIVCGDPSSSDPRARKGVIEILWDIFGGTITEKGYKKLDSHIGCIYGDAITISRCRTICEELERKGFASTNMVYGVGSYTYQNNTRDTFGFALKSTYAVINDKEVFLFKDPITDNGIKKSQKGMVSVFYDGRDITHIDQINSDGRDFLTNDRTNGELLEVIFHNGELRREQTLSEIRTILQFSLK